MSLAYQQPRQLAGKLHDPNHVAYYSYFVFSSSNHAFDIVIWSYYAPWLVSFCSSKLSFAQRTVIYRSCRAAFAIIFTTRLLRHTLKDMIYSPFWGDTIFREIFWLEIAVWFKNVVHRKLFLNMEISEKINPSDMQLVNWSPTERSNDNERVAIVRFS